MGLLGISWEVVEKYISGQDIHNAKSDMYRPRSERYRIRLTKEDVDKNVSFSN
jgi:hypothetical protein